MKNIGENIKENIPPFNIRKLSIAKAAVKLAVYVAVGLVFAGLGKATGIFSSFESAFQGFRLDLNAVLRVIIMAAIALAAENFGQLILSLVKTSSHRAQTLLSISSNALRYIATLVIICWGLAIFGADVGTVVAGMGIITLIVGFGAESLISDMVTGIFMIFENQYNVGDYIEVDGFRGRVVSIGVRTTCLEDAGGNIKIINNSAMTSILNRSDNSSFAVTSIGIPYETDLEALEIKIPTLMVEIYERHRDVFLSVPRYLGVDELADSAVILKFVAEIDDMNIYTGTRALNREIWLSLKKAGVEVPFPQVDVHQK